MNRKYNKYLLITCITVIVFSIVSFFSLSKHSMADETNNMIAAKVNNEPIYDSTVKDIMQKEYYDLVLNQIIDDMLIIQEAKKMNIDIKYLDLEKMSNKDNVVQNAEIMELVYNVVLTRIDDNKLEKYFNERLKGDKYVESKEVWIFDIGHNLGTDLMVEYKISSSIKNAVTKLSIPESKIEKKTIKADEKEMFLKLNNTGEKDIEMIMEEAEHKIIYVDKVIYRDELQFPRDIEVILDQYLTENLGKEMLALISNLRSETEINYYEVNHK